MIYDASQIENKPSWQLKVGCIIIISVIMIMATMNIMIMK